MALIVLVFGSQKAMRSWCDNNMDTSSLCVNYWNPNQFETILPNGTGFRGVVVTGIHDMGRVRGLRPDVLIMDDSVRACGLSLSLFRGYTR